MSAMGFRFDPGPLPFVTIREAKWANRLAELPRAIRIHGEHGCGMPMRIAQAIHVSDYEGPCPEHLADIYKGKKLVVVVLVKPDPCQPLKHQLDREIFMCAVCGMTETEIFDRG